jgi:hypothetical protein
LTAYFSPGDSIIEVMAPKREVRGPNSEPTKALTSSSSSRKRTTRMNPDPKPVPTLSNPERLLRKPKLTQGQSSSSKGNPSSEETNSLLEEKPIVVPSEVVVKKFHQNCSSRNS